MELWEGGIADTRYVSVPDVELLEWSGIEKLALIFGWQAAKSFSILEEGKTFLGQFRRAVKNVKETALTR